MEIIKKLYLNNWKMIKNKKKVRMMQINNNPKKSRIKM